MVGPAWKVDGRAQALVGPGLATPLLFKLQTDSLRTVQTIFRVRGIRWGKSLYVSSFENTV